MPRVRTACELLACFAFLLYLPRLSFKSRDDIMRSATALPTDSSLQSVEDRLRERLKEVKHNSLGSEYVAFHAGRDEVIALAESDPVNAFRRVVLDPVRGLVMLMSPSYVHETISGDMDRFVSCVATLKGIKLRQLLSSRWRREGDPKNTGNEADCSFYFGRKALDYSDAYALGDVEVDAYASRTPPDLVVEVGLIHESKEKHLSYRDRGAVEFWQLNSRPRVRGRTITVAFLDLQASSGPLEIDAPLNLPGLTPAHVTRFMQLRSGKSLDYLEIYEAVRDLLARDALEIREEAEEYELVS